MLVGAVVLVDDRVAPTTADEPVVDREGGDTGDAEGNGQAAPKEGRARIRLHRAGNGQKDHASGHVLGPVMGQAVEKL